MAAKPDRPHREDPGALRGLTAGNPSQELVNGLDSDRDPGMLRAAPDLQHNGSRPDTIAIGTSAGGHKALMRLLDATPDNLRAAIFVTMHYPAGETINMLNRHSRLPVGWASDREPIQAGRVYVAPPDRHMILKPKSIRLVHGPRENRFRPSIDPLFRSAAIAYGPRVIGIILTGLLDDGVAGLMAIKKCGGIAIAQDPEEAEFPEMPRSAIKHARVDHTLAVGQIADLLGELTQQPIDPGRFRAAPREVLLEQAILEQTMSGIEGNMELGEPSALTCPDCNGVLWHIHEGGLVRFRCQVGHSYTADSMFIEQSEALENSLWAALRAFEERRKLCEAMAESSREQGHDRAAKNLDLRAHEAKKHGDALRTILLNGREFDRSDRPSVQEHLAAEDVRQAEIELDARGPRSSRAGAPQR